jgi:hypothetical protein
MFKDCGKWNYNTKSDSRRWNSTKWEWKSTKLVVQRSQQFFFVDVGSQISDTAGNGRRNGQNAEENSFKIDWVWHQKIINRN